jgi:hypothetical protein
MPSRPNTESKVCAAAGLRCSIGSKKSSTRVKRPARSVLAIWRKTAATIE